MKRVCATVGVATVLTGCADVDRFDNGDGSAYCGNIIGAPFVRERFDHRPRLQLSLDTDSLNEFPGKITTDDASDGPCAPQATFKDAELRTPQKLLADPLSLLEFGDGREFNLLTWVDSSCDDTYLAVVSLMRDDSVEVRLLRSQVTADGEEGGPFGVFQLRRSAADCGF